MQLADLVVASKIVNGKYQHFYISLLVQVFNNREIANNSCVKGKSSINECSSCITGNDRSLRLRLGNSPRLQPGAFVNTQNWSGKICLPLKTGQEKSEGRYCSQVPCAYMGSYKESTSLPVSKKDKKTSKIERSKQTTDTKQTPLGQK